MNLSWLTNPTVFAVNRLEAHSDHITYASHQEEKEGVSSLYQSLDGTWMFQFSPSISSRPERFFDPVYDLSNFGTITVPGHIELQGHGQIQYINTLYPWDGHAHLRPPEIDWEHTTVGSYVKIFDLSPSLLNKEVCISFQGAEQAIAVWLNGHFIGYSEDSFTPSDFVLTPYLRETDNRLCVEVYQRCSASWLEDQDFFRFSGLFRSVFLYGKPCVHVEDLWLKTSLSADNKTGTLSPRFKLRGDGASISCVITAPDGKQLYEDILPLTKDGDYFTAPAITLQNIMPWQYKAPHLYKVILTVTDSDGTVQEVIPYSVGFRRIAIENGIITLNGERLLLCGVNRHEWNPHKGRAIDLRDMESAMETFLKNNINAVRTSHYPNQTAWYHLCDQNGIYVMDEANLESHGSWQKLGAIEPSWNVPGNHEEWKACVVDRARSMFERDKNHPSILFWSCGNESYAGEDILAMANFFREHDPDRLVHYEGCVHNRAYEAITDVESRMYASPDAIREYLTNHPKKPFLLCEYMHDMGNSLGGMESYSKLSEEFPQYQGGFIWDYMDQALYRTNHKGESVLGYGGDFGERPTDYAFSGNGIVFADGSEKPCMQEVRYFYASQDQKAAQDAQNKAAASGLTLPSPSRNAPLTIIHGDGGLGVKGDGFSLLFSYPEGGLASLVTRGREWIWRAPRPAFWRAATENDHGNGFDSRSSIWAAVDRWQVVKGYTIHQESDTTVEITYTFSAPAMPELLTEITYTVSHTGRLTISALYHGSSNRPELPLFGVRMQTPVPADTVEWIGLSGETYPDRKKGGVFGVHREIPHIPDYLVPQECGHHEDTHQVTLHCGDDTLTLQKATAPFGFSALPYTPQQLDEAAHKDELPTPCRTVVTITGAMRGVGGIDSWGSDVEVPYRVSSEQDITTTFSILL